MVSSYRERLSEVLARLRARLEVEPDYGYSDVESDSGYIDSSKNSHPESERVKSASMFGIDSLNEDVQALISNPPPRIP